jgi:cell division protein FtsB
MSWITNIISSKVKLILTINGDKLLISIINNNLLLTSRKLIKRKQVLEELDKILAYYPKTPLYIFYGNYDENLSLIKTPHIESLTIKQLSKELYVCNNSSLQDILILNRPTQAEEHLTYLHVKCKSNEILNEVVGYILNKNAKLKGIYSLSAINLLLCNQINNILAASNPLHYQVFYIQNPIGTIKQFIFKGKDFISTKDLNIKESYAQEEILSLIIEDIKVSNSELHGNKTNIKYIIVSDSKFFFKKPPPSNLQVWSVKKFISKNQKLSSAVSFEEAIIKYLIKNKIRGFIIKNLAQIKLYKFTSFYIILFLSLLFIIALNFLGQELYKTIKQAQELQSTAKVNQTLSLQKQELENLIKQLHQTNDKLAELDTSILTKNNYPFSVIKAIITNKNPNICLIDFYYLNTSSIVGKSVTIFNIKAINNTDRNFVDNVTEFINQLQKEFPHSHIKYLRNPNENMYEDIPIEIKIIEPIKN